MMRELPQVDLFECTFCGADVKAEDNFCSKCGRDVSEIETAATHLSLPKINSHKQTFESNSNLKTIKLAFIITVLLFILLYATNPTKAEFQDFARVHIKQEILDAGVTSNSFFDNLIATFTGKIAEKAVDILITRDNYQFFSIYRVEGVDLDYQFLGVFRQFIPLKNFINAETINATFRDIITLFDEKIQLNEDYYAARKIELTGSTEVNIKAQLISGIPFEMLFVDEQNYEAYLQRINGKRGTEIHYIPSLSESNITNVDKAIVLDKGTYYVIFDNTDLGQTVPPMNFRDDSAYFTIKITSEEVDK